MFYMYRVGWYNSYEDEEKYDRGIVYASDYGTAADRGFILMEKTTYSIFSLKKL